MSEEWDERSVRGVGVIKVSEEWRLGRWDVRGVRLTKVSEEWR